ncbi:unnamed protein product [Knipowitschia caucasica]
MSQTSSNTFCFTHEEGNNIIVKDSLFNMDNPQAAEEQTSYNELKKLMEKEKKLELHAITLSDYWREGIIPRGLRINKFPSFGKENVTFKQKWEAILNKCSFDLMLLLIEEAKHQRTEIRQQIPEVKQKLSDLNKTPEQKETAAETEAKMSKSLTELNRLVTRKKMEKFQRDKNDYSTGAVYSWQRRFTRAPARKPQSVSFSLPSSASEEDDFAPQSQTNSFLDNTPDATLHTREKRDGGEKRGGRFHLRPRQPHRKR